jgi:diacylglycerol kinase family enzyme
VRYFVNVATFGMSGLIGALVKESSSALGGTLSYYLAAVRGLLRYHLSAASRPLEPEVPPPGARGGPCRAGR